MAMFVSSVSGGGVRGAVAPAVVPRCARESARVARSASQVRMGAFDGELEEMSRRHLLQALGAASMLAITGMPLVRAEEAVAPPADAPAPPAAAPAPKPAPVADTNMSFGLSGVYKTDAESLVSNMKTVTEYARGTPGMADTVTGVRKQMNDFVALYRRNGKVSGSSSFSTLYTSINTLSGHYQSYGNGYPVPEKRRKRLLAQYKEVEKALDKGR